MHSESVCVSCCLLKMKTIIEALHSFCVLFLFPSSLLFIFTAHTMKGLLLQLVFLTLLLVYFQSASAQQEGRKGGRKREGEREN